MNKYEGLFILNTAGKEENIKEILDQISDEIKAVGGRVEGIQKMDKKPFARGNNKRKEGYYVNFLFQAPPGALVPLRQKLTLSGLVFRQFYTRPAPPPRFARPATPAEPAKT